MVTFLQARVAEDELTAQAATEESPRWRTFYDYRDVKDDDGRYVVQADTQHPTLEQAAHIARHCPSRVLRECAVKRAVIADFLRLDDGEVHLPERSVTEEVLRGFCSVYSDHPDYDPSWS